jgi:hypothetical protein
MVYKISFKPIVFIDIEEAYLYYEKIVTGLGGRFYEKLLFAIGDIEKNPTAYSFIYEPVRRHLIKGFPYKIFYIIKETQVVVLGIAHVKRSSKFIKGKINR